MNDEVSGDEPQALDAFVMEIDNRVHLSVEALRGVGDDKKINAYMDEGTDEVVPKSPKMFLERYCTRSPVMPWQTACRRDV